MNTDNHEFRDLRAEVAPYLHPDENLLWTGQPYASRKYRPNPISLIFMLFWFGFSVFWTIMATAGGGFFGLFGIPFMLVGGTVLYTLLFGQKKRLAFTIYAVTDRRAIILFPDRRGTSCTEFIFARLNSITMEDVDGTTGSIRFLPENHYYSDMGSDRYHRGRQMDGDMSTAFLCIDRVQEVYRLISEQMNA